MARDKSTPPPSSRGFTASAARVDLTDGKRAARVLSKRSDAQADAWDFFDTLSEVSFPAIWVGAIMQKVVFYAATRDAKGNIVPVNAEASPLAGTMLAVQAEFEMTRLRSERGGQGELNKVGAMNLEVAGEYVLWGRPANPAAIPPIPERWDVLSVREVEQKQATEGAPATYLVKRSPNDKGEETGPDDVLIRIWQRHPAWGAVATSSVMSCLTDCDTLLTLSQEIRAQSKSRQNAGIFRVPTELNMKITSSEDDVDDERIPFDERLAQAITTPIENPDDASSVVPLIVSGPGEFLKPDVFGWTSFGRTTDSSTDDRMDKLTHRIARGIHLPVEVLLGHMETTFSNAAQIARDKFDEFLDPRCRTMAEAYTVGFLTPQLSLAAQVADGIDPSKIADVFVWFDASDVVGSPDPTDAADKLHEEGMISDAAYRRLKGVDEADAPTEAERAIAIAMQKGTLDATQTAALLRAAAVNVPDPAAPPADPQASTMAALAMLGMRLDAIAASAVPHASAAPVARLVETRAVTAAKPRTANLGRRLVDIERGLRAKVQGAVEAAVDRMLERAGAKLRSKRTIAASAPKTVPNYSLAASLGPDVITAAGFADADLYANAWDRLHDPFVHWCIDAGLASFDLIAAAAAKPFHKTRRAAYEQQLRRQAEDGWRELVTGLDDLAGRLLYAPSPDLHQMRVPPSLIRRALRVAGGETGRFTVVAALSDDDEGDGFKGAAGVPRSAAVTIPSMPVGEVAMGESMMGLLDEAGLGVQAFVWVYGPAGRAHPFEPHAELDGETFENFDDPVLAIDGDWPDSGFYYPGDHDGCLCDFEMTIIEGGSDRSEPTRPDTSRMTDYSPDLSDHRPAGVVHAIAVLRVLDASFTQNGRGMQRFHEGYGYSDEDLAGNLRNTVKWLNEEGDARARWVADNWSPEQREVFERFAQEVANSPVEVRVSEFNLKDILDSGRLMSQFETGMSNGTFDMSMRAEVEFAAFGVPTDVADAARPIYGYLNSTLMDSGDVVSQYGRIALVLDDAVAPRTTMTLMDSLGSDAKGLALDAVRSGSVPAEGLARSVIPSLFDPATGVLDTQYAEVQIHGGVTTSMIREIRVDASFMASDKIESLKGLLSGHDFPWSIIDRAGQIIARG